MQLHFTIVLFSIFAQEIVCGVEMVIEKVKAKRSFFVTWYLKNSGERLIFDALPAQIQSLSAVFLLPLVP